MMMLRLVGVPNAGQFIKVPPCEPSRCVIQLYRFICGAYKDLAHRYETTVGQITMLRPTYNYSEDTVTGNNVPAIYPPTNCAALVTNVTVFT